MNFNFFNKLKFGVFTAISIVVSFTSILISAPIAEAATQNIVFTSNGSFTVPAGVTSITVDVAGGGGGGGGGAFTYGGGGGGGAESYQGLVFAVTPGQVIPVTIGNGGAGGSSGSYYTKGGNGGAGGTTIFGSYLSAFGGKGGKGAIIGGGGGQGGDPGGIGGTKGTNGDSFYGERTKGGNGGNSTLAFGGTGGVGSAYSSVPPVSGTKGSGGGGGSGWNGNDAGATGGKGYVSISYNPPVRHTITASSGANGTISPSGTSSFVNGSSQTYTFTPNAGYSIYDVVVDGVSQGAVFSYTFSSINSNHTISVSFARTLYTISATSTVGGTVTPSGNQNVLYGNNLTFTFTPSAGYNVGPVVVDGVLTSATSSYTFTGVIANHTINVSFVRINHTVTSSAGPNGSITPLGVQNVLDGGNISFLITPNAGYAIGTTTVDGVATTTGGSYTFSNVTSNHTINASFVFIPPTTHTITSTSGANGTITPLGATVVTDGTDQTFTITPSAGYAISTFTVDGVATTASSTYTFVNNSADHTIDVSFALIPASDSIPPTDVVVSSLSHDPSVISSNTTVDMSWTDSTDLGGSLLSGYSYLFDTSSTTIPDNLVDGIATNTSATLPFGTYYFHVKAVDGAGNSSNTSHFGPIVISDSSVLYINSTIGGVYYSVFSPSLSVAASASTTGNTTIKDSTITTWWNINNSNLDHVTLDNSDVSLLNATNTIILNSIMTNCLTSNALVKNYSASNCTVRDSIIDPPSGLYLFVDSTADASSTVLTSDITSSTIIHSYIDTSVIDRSTITNSTSTYSGIGDSSVTDSTIDNSIFTFSTSTSSTISNSTTTSSVITGTTIVGTDVSTSTVSSSSLTGGSVSDSTVDGSTLSGTTISHGSDVSHTTTTGSLPVTITHSTVASTTLDSSSITDSSVTFGSVISSSVSSSTLISSDVSTSTVTSSHLAHSTVASSTVSLSDLSSSTLTGSSVASSTVASTTLTSSTVASSTLTGVSLTSATVSGSTLTGVTILGSGSTITDTVLASTTISDAVIVSGVMMSGTITLPTGATTTITVPTPVASLVEYSPVASFSATSTGTSVTLSDLTTDINSGTSIGDSYTYVWDFGDGATTTSTSTTVGVPSVTHTYPIDGTYTVKLTVVDAFGASSVYTSTITVSTPTVTPAPTVVPGGNGPIVGAFGMFIPPTNNPLDDKQVIVRKDGEGAEILAKKTQYRFENDLYFGLKGDEVSRLQDILREKGFFIASSTGYFGAITRNAVIEYQRTNKINTTGYVGPKTRASLNGDKFEVGSYIQTPKASTSTTKTTNKEIISTSSIGNRANGSVEEKSGLRDRVDNFVKKILNIFGR